MKKEARKGTDQRSRLNIGEAVEPVEEGFNGLADRADRGKCPGFLATTA